MFSVKRTQKQKTKKQRNKKNQSPHNERKERKRIMSVRKQDFKRGGIYMVDLGLTKQTSHIQQGSRPCIVLSNEAACVFSPTLSVVPMTSKELRRVYPTQLPLIPNETNKLNGKTTALCEQLTTATKDQFAFKIGDLTEEELEKLEQCVHLALGF